MQTFAHARLALITLFAAAVGAGCSMPSPRVGDRVERRGEEIMVAGQLFHVGAPVVLWTDPGGYDAYRVERRFAPADQAAWEPGQGGRTPNRYGIRRNISEETFERVRGGGWSLDELREAVDQFVLHYDVAGTSRSCFRILHDMRGLSVHFMLDLDGTIYQTLDAKERAWHATIANDRSVGIEIANIGAYPLDRLETLERWYGTDEFGRTVVTLPPERGDGGIRTPGFVARPDRQEMVVGKIHGRELAMYDLTPEQYESLARLTAALSVALPRIELDYPRDERGEVLRRALTREEFERFSGVLGHFHVQEDKVDPGPAMQWERVIREARRHLPARLAARDRSGDAR